MSRLDNLNKSCVIINVRYNIASSGYGYKNVNRTSRRGWRKSIETNGKIVVRKSWYGLGVLSSLKYSQLTHGGALLASKKRIAKLYDELADTWMDYQSCWLFHPVFLGKSINNLWRDDFFKRPKYSTIMGVTRCVPSIPSDYATYYGDLSIVAIDNFRWGNVCDCILNNGEKVTVELKPSVTISALMQLPLYRSVYRLTRQNKVYRVIYL